MRKVDAWADKKFQEINEKLDLVVPYTKEFANLVPADKKILRDAVIQIYTCAAQCDPNVIYIKGAKAMEVERAGYQRKRDDKKVGFFELNSPVYLAIPWYYQENDW